VPVYSVKVWISIGLHNRRRGFPLDKKATNWPGCIKTRKHSAKKPDAIAVAGWRRLDENEIQIVGTATTPITSANDRWRGLASSDYQDSDHKKNQTGGCVL
jgi:hypothetical protein